ncbi:hypothetical protein LWC34_04040 [Kibdelosporangium philippinense]|uniref:Uncharacterized protein n=1 Tax=Kibdelosporangium philippinense TaxID=211113 RepID=A0ABS8Z5U3_9PSEU|nr:hypothetical protein [Kibdelosporangium philippinense]MCE7002006.1 hypothetical protein [Kibdelosporangium philippinense]
MSETSAVFGVAKDCYGNRVFGMIGTAAYRDLITVPSGFLPRQRYRAADSIAGAVREASTLPGLLTNGLLVTAREAFTSDCAVVGRRHDCRGVRRDRNDRAAQDSPVGRFGIDVGPGELLIILYYLVPPARDTVVHSRRTIWEGA